MAHKPHGAGDQSEQHKLSDALPIIATEMEKAVESGPGTASSQQTAESAEVNVLQSFIGGGASFPLDVSLRPQHELVFGMIQSFDKHMPKTGTLLFGFPCPLICQGRRPACIR